MQKDIRKKPTILTIDDDAIILNSILSTLRGEYNVIPFTSGAHALSYLEQKTADLILLDYHMPGLSGFDVLKRLHENPQTIHIPVIFLTGSVDGEDEIDALKMGAVDYILKPIKPQSLITRISVQLELQNHRRNLEAMVEEKTYYLNAAYNKLKAREDLTLSLLAKVTDLRDSETGMHIERTTEYVRVIADDLIKNPTENYILSKNEANDIIRSAKLHDIGKVAIPDHILLKPGKLTEEEFEIMKTHTTHGAELLVEFTDKMNDDDFLRTAHDITLSHHEKWSGAGYPQGLSGFDIPLSARISAIADVYDALTTERPYKKPFSHEKSVEIILSDSGRHFDPYLVTVFERHNKLFDDIANHRVFDSEKS